MAIDIAGCDVETTNTITRMRDTVLFFFKQCCTKVAFVF